MSLFRLGEFSLASGASAPWKIECDELGWGDWITLAYLASEILPHFGEVIAVGGAAEGFAAALRYYSVKSAPQLIADDVLTTGASMEKCKRECGNDDSIGVVAFARAPYSGAWIRPLFIFPWPPGAYGAMITSTNG